MRGSGWGTNEKVDVSVYLFLISSWKVFSKLCSSSLRSSVFVCCVLLSFSFSLWQLGKEQLLDALRFGADKVFRSKDTSITDADIDAIMAHGKASTVSSQPCCLLV